MAKIICPYCGYESESDNLEIYEDGEHCNQVCDNCDQEYIVTIHLRARYITSKLKEPNDG